MVLETDDDGAVVGINSFLDTARLFPLFGLPPRDPDVVTRAGGSTKSTE